MVKLTWELLFWRDADWSFGDGAGEVAQADRRRQRAARIGFFIEVFYFG
jgi:hypothetical protein